jgi:60 kDa SS-A/Ro ribonucleoprotein
MKINKMSTSAAFVPTVTPIFTHEGAPAKRITPLLELRRSVLATMLWEDGFYESGEAIASRIQKLVSSVKPDKVASLAVEARTKGKLRHIPLFIARAMAPLPTHRGLVADVLSQVIQRPDELTEFLALYWKEKKQPLSAQVKKGLARAFTKFDEYQLAKYNRDAPIKLRDVLFLTHAKPLNQDQDKLWKKLVGGYCSQCWRRQDQHGKVRHAFKEAKLSTPDTWEVALSATEGENKKESWERLLKEEKLGALALLRNLRNFKQNGVQESLVRNAIKNMRIERVLPYRFITAAKYAPNLEPELETAMFKAIETKGKIGGKTVLLIDVSGSMDAKISDKSEATRVDCATGLAILAREMFQDVEVFTFSNDTVAVPTRRGFALRDAIVNSQSHGGTDLGGAVEHVAKIPYERLIVFTDEQSRSAVGNPRRGSHSYMINVASNQYGVGYGAWNHIDGFSEAVLDYIIELEKLQAE